MDIFESTSLNGHKSEVNRGHSPGFEAVPMVQDQECRSLSPPDLYPSGLVPVPMARPDNGEPMESLFDLIEQLYDYDPQSLPEESVEESVAAPSIDFDKIEVWDEIQDDPQVFLPLDPEPQTPQKQMREDFVITFDWTSENMLDLGFEPECASERKREAVLENNVLTYMDDLPFTEDLGPSVDHWADSVQESDERTSKDTVAPQQTPSQSTEMELCDKASNKRKRPEEDSDASETRDQQPNAVKRPKPRHMVHCLSKEVRIEMLRKGRKLREAQKVQKPVLDEKPAPVSPCPAPSASSQPAAPPQDTQAAPEPCAQCVWGSDYSEELTLEFRSIIGADVQMDPFKDWLLEMFEQVAKKYKIRAMEKARKCLRILGFLDTDEMDIRHLVESLMTHVPKTYAMRHMEIFKHYFKTIRPHPPPGSRRKRQLINQPDDSPSNNCRKHSPMYASSRNHPYAAPHVQPQPTYMPPRMPTYMETSMPPRMPTYMETSMPPRMPTYMETYMPPRMPTYMETHMPPRMPTYMETYMPPRMPTYMETYMPPRMPTYMETYMPPRMPTYMDTHMPPCMPPCEPLNAQPTTHPHQAQSTQTNVCVTPELVADAHKSSVTGGPPSASEDRKQQSGRFQELGLTWTQAEKPTAFGLFKKLQWDNVQAEVKIKNKTLIHAVLQDKFIHLSKEEQEELNLMAKQIPVKMDPPNSNKT